ncbi:nitroreductase [Methanohalophilus levihalophilus]|uniref:nitroreductase family protein n=1 Tax=Methanohalophilus levihalophilus TaxID=1431282 RepID=UPI001AE70DB7|nr:nitroreductase family protein [Methanohalophilus levihalophilus]MBP2031132.1 nitroreductase [Methanohalophilus levihalophilus]
MDVIEAIEKRISIRKFTDAAVPLNIIDRILSAGIQAPNAFNSEPWEFILVKEGPVKDELISMRRKIPPQKTALETAAFVIVVCYNNEMGNEALSSAYACVENMLLAATSFGLGAVPLTFHGKKIRELLELPEGFEIASVIPFGYPAESPEKPLRKPVTEKLHIGKF